MLLARVLPVQKAALVLWPLWCIKVFAQEQQSAAKKSGELCIPQTAAVMQRSLINVKLVSCRTFPLVSLKWTFLLLSPHLQDASSPSVPSAPPAQPPSSTPLTTGRPQGIHALSQLESHTDSITTTAAGRTTNETRREDVFLSAVCLV